MTTDAQEAAKVTAPDAALRLGLDWARCGDAVDRAESVMPASQRLTWHVDRAPAKSVAITDLGPGRGSLDPAIDARLAPHRLHPCDDRCRAVAQPIPVTLPRVAALTG